MCVSERAVVEAGVVFVAPATRPHCGSTCSLTPHKGAVLLTPGCTGPSLSLRGGVGARCVCACVAKGLPPWNTSHVSRTDLPHPNMCF